MVIGPNQSTGGGVSVLTEEMPLVVEDWVEAHTLLKLNISHFCIFIFLLTYDETYAPACTHRHRQTDRQTDRHTHTQTFYHPHTNTPVQSYT